MVQLLLDLQPVQTEFRIPLTQGQFAIVDQADFERLSRFNWQAQWNPNTNSFYAKRGRGIMMAREIMRAPAGTNVDHWDHDTLDNRRRNLRMATPSQNSYNKRKRCDNTSGFKGVVWEARKKLWRVRITVNGKRKCVGRFKNLQAAGEAYKSAAHKLHGEFAYLN